MIDSLFCLPRPALPRFKNQITDKSCYKIVSSKCFTKGLPRAGTPCWACSKAISSHPCWHVRRDFYSSVDAEKDEWQQSSNAVVMISGFFWILKHMDVTPHFVLLKSTLLLVKTESNNINPNINWACKMEHCTKVGRRSEMSIRHMKGLVGE